ncbi:MAG: hypothetical protein KC619_08335 [Myxococcales bacterium]|nr:hypothetical protein [Myxococcales bacterium]
MAARIPMDAILGGDDAEDVVLDVLQVDADTARSAERSHAWCACPF